MNRVPLLLTTLCCVVAVASVEGSSLQVKPIVGLSLNSYSTGVEDFEASWGSKTGTSFGALAGLRFIPQVAGVIKLHVFEKKQEMRLWHPQYDSLTYKVEWNQFFITVAARYYPVTLARVSPYVDLGFLYSSVTEKFEAIITGGHGNTTVSGGGVGGALGAGIQVWLTPQLSVFGEAQVVAVTVKAGNEWRGIENERAAGCRFLGGGISLLF